jgi:acetylornithine deacetylase/succinyl-diaminopimelate desuccinylase-like protein
MDTSQETNLPIIKSLIEKNRDQILEDYYTFLSFSSISSESEFKQQVLDCADWLKDYLEEMGFKVELWPTSNHPIIYASYLEAGPSKPTLLIYNHYDVQPVDPLSEWSSPPFKPTLREGEVYARGAQDNKGQCFYVLQALKLMLKQNGSLPINVKLCIEGEEEMGSAGLSQILKKRPKELQTDFLAIVDLGLRDAQVPAVTLGIRGLVTMDVEVKGANIDLHSGSHGGIVPNPIHILVEMLSNLRNDKGKITIPGFYDQVLDMPLEERSKVSFNFDLTDYQKTTGAYPVGGEKEFSALERAWIRPTLEINGIYGGYTGSGFKTVIPAKAWAKISCRLVPNQDPHQIGELVANYLRANAPQGVQITINTHPGIGKAVRANASAKIVTAFSKAFEEVFGVPCEFIFEGASIPIVTELAEVCGGEVILIGLGLPGDQIHAPNEHFGLDRIEKGILIIARGLELLAAYKPNK